MKNFKMIVSYDGTRYKGWQVLKKEENTIQGKLQNILSLLMGEPVQVIGSGRTDAGVHARGQVANFHLDQEKAVRMLADKFPKQANRSLAAQLEKNFGAKLEKSLAAQSEQAFGAQLRKCSDAQLPKGFVAQQNKGLATSGSGGSGCQSVFLAELLYEYMNYYLPEDIAVLSVEEVPERFHARYNAVRKTYCYRIHTGSASNVFERKYVYDYREHPLNIDRMRQAADLLCGTHDFATFCGNRHMKKSTVRTVESIEIRSKGDEIRLAYTGDGFLQNMIRILTGTLIEVGIGQRDPMSMTELLEAKDREQAGYTAPPQGLILDHVEYR